VFLFDEPLSNLDAALRVQTRIEIARLHTDMKATMIYVTHDQVEAMTLADRIVVLNAGRIEQVGTPLELYHRPANLFVAGFIGSPQMNFIPVEAIGIEPGGAKVRLPNGSEISVPARTNDMRPGEALTLGIRPDRVAVGPGGMLSGRIALVEELGENHLLYIDTEHGLRLTARAPGDTDHAAGDAVSVRLSLEDCHLFKRSGEALAPTGARAAPAQTRRAGSV
jgi:multiple sugar transport system ATP-binding protein